MGDAGSRVDPYDAWLRAEFDAAAPDYAQRIERNPVENRYRRRSIGLLLRTFPRPGRLLEIGCGPGTETMAMLRADHQVVALDISSEMLARLTACAESEGFASALTVRLLRARELPALAGEGEAGAFDGAYSTFGALNLEPDLAPVAHGLAGLLRPGAPFVAGIFNRHSLLEPLASLVTGRPRRALARVRQPVPVGFHRFSVDVYLRSIPELAAALAGSFFLRESVGLGIVLPPPDLADRLDRIGVRWDRLDRWDSRLGARSGFAAFADTVLAVFERSESR